MAAPVASTRGVPAGTKLKDGYSTKIAFATALTIAFWEKTVQPPGYDGGEPIENTTMHNTLWRTLRSRALLTATPHTVKAAYDPNCYSGIQSLINVETTVTCSFPDGATLAFYGFLQKFEPDAHEEGKMPEATVTVVPTNWDPVNQVEAGPTLTPHSGT
jgi:hypothetical protein